jgi:hypothetical protein
MWPNAQVGLRPPRFEVSKAPAHTHIRTHARTHENGRNPLNE